MAVKAVSSYSSSRQPGDVMWRDDARDAVPSYGTVLPRLRLKQPSQFDLVTY